MKLDFSHLVPEEFSDSSRVWIYQSNRVFTLSEALTIEDLLSEFTANWKSHGTPVKGFGTLFFGQFIILMADEAVTGVSGCSTDSSVRFIKSMEESFNVSLFDRTTLAFYINEKLQLLPISQIQYAFERSFITVETLFFDNTVLTKKELLTKWITPIGKSWLANRFSLEFNG
ncbi:MAG: hypothetical protein ACK5AO_03205 [bacterium]|jgi:hypothetical protein